VNTVGLLQYGISVRRGHELISVKCCFCVPEGKFSVLNTKTFYTNYGLGMWCAWVRRGECIGSWWGNRWEGDDSGDLGVDGWIILGWVSRMWDVGI